MAAVLRNVEIGMRKTGTSVNVPNNHKANLMFYLDCICNLLNLENDTENLARLKDFQNYFLLTENEVDNLLIICLLVSPKELMDKVIFANDELCGDHQNQFYELSAVQNQLVVSESILIGGTQRRVQKIMTFKMSFLQENYIEPIKFYQSRIARILSGGQQHQTPAITYSNTYSRQNSYSRSNSDGVTNSSTSSQQNSYSRSNSNMDTNSSTYSQQNTYNRSNSDGKCDCCTIL